MSEAVVLPRLEPAKAGMGCFLISEAAFFSSLIVTYLTFLEQSRPIAAEVLHLPLTLVSTACLLSSSLTVHLAFQAFQAGRRSAFVRLWAATIGLGILFLVGTAIEWHGLIGGYGLWLNSNSFGSTYFTLVGFHAAHVTLGVLLLLTILGLVLRGNLLEMKSPGVELISWYWHFVDGVWVVVFSVVYLLGR